MKIKLFDSFAGIGSLHKALRNLRVDVELVGMSETDIEAIRAYNAIHYNKTWEEIDLPTREEMETFLKQRNIGLDFKRRGCKLPKGDKLKEIYKICKALNNYGDISFINPKDLPDFDLFNFSFPCTDMSVAGQQKGLIDENGNLTRSGLYVYGMEIIKVKKPKYIMIENVKNLISKKFKPYFDNMIKELEEVGYNCYWQVLNAKDYGIPQNRERVFVICIRKDVDNNKFEFPQPFDNGLRLKDFLDIEVDEKYYIDDVKVDELINQLKDNQKGSYPNKEFQVSYALSSREHRKSGWKEVCPTLCARDFKDPKVVSIAKENSNKCIQVCNLEGVTYTQTAEGGELPGHTGLYLNNYRIRKLTPIEYYKFMGFNDEDIQKVRDIGISDSQMYKQAGNSIVVNVLEEIFKKLFKEKRFF